MRVFIAHSVRDAVAAQALRELLVLAEHEVVDLSSTDGPHEIIAKLRTADVVVAYLVEPSPYALVELGIAVGSGLPTLLVGELDEPSSIDAFDLPSLVPSGSVARDARAVVSALSRMAPSLAPGLKREPTLAQVAAEPSLVDSMTYEAFEMLVGDWLRSIGANFDRAERGEGCDYRLSDGGREFLVEVKKVPRQGRVHVHVLRSLGHAVSLSNSAGGILITSSPLTAAAQSIAAEGGIFVASVKDLMRFTSVDELIEAAADKALQLTGPAAS